MHCSTAGVKQDYGVTGILYDEGSVYEGLSKLTDIRKPKGKLYQLEIVLLIVVLAKLCGDRRMGGSPAGRISQVTVLELGQDAQPSHLSADLGAQSV